MSQPSHDGAAHPATRRPTTPQEAQDLFRRALRWVLLFLAVLAVVSVTAGALTSGVRGMWGALLGTLIAVIFSGTTVWSMWSTSRVTPTRMLAVVAGSWIVKIIVLFATVAVLHGMDFYQPIVLVVVILVGVLGSLAIDLVAFQKARIPYIDAD